MTFSRQFLLGLAALGLQVGMTFAEPPSPPASAALAQTAPTIVQPFAMERLGQATCPTDCVSEDDCVATGRRGIIGGLGLYFIKPYFENNPAYIVNDGRRIPGTNPPQNRVTSSEHVEIEHELGYAPLVWLGYLGDNGLGGRVRYWYFRDGTNQTLAAPNRILTAHPAGLSLIADQPRDLAVTSKLEVQVLDLEGVSNLRACDWDFLLAAGVRLTRLSQDYNAFVSFGPGPVLSLLSDHTFQGAGPTLAGEVRHALGESGLALYGSARGSVVFGTARQTAFIPLERNEGTDERNRGLLIGELELGVEYGRMLGTSWLFGQVALVGQDWFGAGSASRSTMLTSAGNDFIGGGYTVDSDIAFLGLCVRLGVNY